MSPAPANSNCRHKFVRNHHSFLLRAAGSPQRDSEPPTVKVDTESASSGASASLSCSPAVASLTYLALQRHAAPSRCTWLVAQCLGKLNQQLSSCGSNLHTEMEIHLQKGANVTLGPSLPGYPGKPGMPSFPCENKERWRMMVMMMEKKEDGGERNSSFLKIHHQVNPTI